MISALSIYSVRVMCMCLFCVDLFWLLCIFVVRMYFLCLFCVYLYWFCYGFNICENYQFILRFCL